MGRIVKTIYGNVEGIETEHAFLFKGIPFAKAPVGDLRFKAPRPPEAFEETFKANQFGYKSVQEEQKQGSFYQKEFYDDDAFLPQSNEDCLTLNIWAPKEACDAAVAIWFHGGGFAAGFSGEKEFDGEEYAKRGVILVSANYRLGLLGFFAHPQLQQEDGNSGNYGILDQIAAIDYVKDNIKAFGGNPDQITIFGQSAGAISIKNLLCSPLVKGKIKGAILQSGGGMNVLSTSLRQEKLANAYASYLKKHHLTVQQLKNYSTDQLQKLKHKMSLHMFFKTGNLLAFGPCIDHKIIEETFEEAVNGNRLPDIAYMIGSNKEDIGTNRKKKQDKVKNSNEKFNAILKEQGRTTYQYYFVRQLPGDQAGAFHSAELWYMFATLKRCWRNFGAADEELSQRMVNDWCQFIKEGKPTYAAYPHIEIYDVKE